MNRAANTPKAAPNLPTVVNAAFEAIETRLPETRTRLPESMTKRTAETFLEGEPQALKQAIDWNALRPILRELRQLNDLSSLTLTAKQWLALSLVVFVLISAMTTGWVAHLLLNAALVSLLTLAFLLRKYRVTGFIDSVTPRVMHYDSFDRNRQFAHRFVYSEHIGGKAVTQAYDVAEELTVAPASGWSIGLFSSSGDCLALLTKAGQQVDVVTPASPPFQSQVTANVLPSAVDSVAKNSAEALDVLEGDEPSVERSAVTRESVAAAWASIALARDTLQHLVRSQLLFAFSDVAAPRGILFKGPPGTGKSLISQAFAKGSGAPLLKVNLADLKAAHVGESAQSVKDLWRRARAHQPSIIFVDECEGAFPKRGSDQSDTFTNEIVQTFLAEWDGGDERSHVMVLGATNRPELLDDAVLSRFTDVIELQTPNGASFAELVTRVFEQTGVRVPVSSELLSLVAGMSGRELRNVAERSLRAAGTDTIDLGLIESAVAAVRGKVSVRTSASASWNTLVLGPDTLKRLQSLAVMAAQAPILIERGIPVPRAVLIFGPPGTGKTQIARTLANEARMTFIAKSTADLKGQYLGHAAARVKAAFESARVSTPSILFLDEIDGLASSRGGDSDQLKQEALLQLLQEMDGIAAQTGYVLVIGATNVPENLDAAVLSRFSHRIEIALPDLGARRRLFETALAGRPVASGIELDHIASATEGWSGRDINGLVMDAFNAAVNRCIEAGEDLQAVSLTQQDLVIALTEGEHSAR